MAVLWYGGSAVEPAVAAAAMLAVVKRQSTDIDGSAFCLSTPGAPRRPKPSWRPVSPARRSRAPVRGPCRTQWPRDVAMAWATRSAMPDGGKRRRSPVTCTQQQCACLTGVRPKRHFFAMGAPASGEQARYCGQPAGRRSQPPGDRRSKFRRSVQSHRPAGSGAWRAAEREHRVSRDNGLYDPEIRYRSEFSGHAGDAGVGRPPRPRAAGFDSHRRSWQRGVPAAPISTKDLYRAGTRSWRETRLQRLRHSLLRPQQVTAQVPKMRKRGPNHAAEDGGGRAKDRRRQ